MTGQRRALLLAYTSYASAAALILHNPAEEAAILLRGAKVGGCSVVVHLLPVAWKAVRDAESLLDTVEPEVAVGVGLNPSARSVTVELAGANVGYGKDFDGATLDGQRLVDGEPFGKVYPVAANPAELKRCLESRGVDGVRFSLTAGSYLCNALAYTLYRWAHARGKRAVFLHVPPAGSETLTTLSYAGYSVRGIAETVEAVLACLCRLE